MKNGLVEITLWYFRLICVMLMHLSYFFGSDKAFFFFSWFFMYFLCFFFLFLSIYFYSIFPALVKEVFN